MLHTCTAETETNQENNTEPRQPRFSGLEEPIFLIRPVTKNGSGMRHPINRKSNPIPMAPMMGNGFLIRAKNGIHKYDKLRCNFSFGLIDFS